MKGVILLILLLLAAPALAVQFEKSPGFWAGPGLMPNNDMVKMESRFLQSLSTTLNPASESPIQDQAGSGLMPNSDMVKMESRFLQSLSTTLNPAGANPIQGQAGPGTGTTDDEKPSADATSSTEAEATAPVSVPLSTADCGNCTGLNCTGLCVDLNCTGDNCTGQMAGLNCTSLNCSSGNCSGVCGGLNCTGILCSVCSGLNCTCSACPAASIAGMNSSDAGGNISGESGIAVVSAQPTGPVTSDLPVVANNTSQVSQSTIETKSYDSGQEAASAVAGNFNGFWGMEASKEGFGKEGIKSRTSLSGDFEVDNSVVFHEPAT